MAAPTLLFVYGPPAVGKLTVARAVAAISGFRVLHNDLVALLDEYDVFQPLAGRPSLTVDTEQLTPALAAEHIVSELGL